MRQLRVSRPPNVNDRGLQDWMDQVYVVLNSLPSDVSDIAITSNYTPLVGNQFITANASGSTISIFLPSSVTDVGSFYYVKKTDSSANAVVLVGTIDGAANASIATQNYSLTVRKTGSGYFIY